MLVRVARIPGDSSRDLFGMVSSRDPFKGLSDLQLGDEKGTLNHLVVFYVWFLSVFFGTVLKEKLAC